MFGDRLAGFVLTPYTDEQKETIERYMNIISNVKHNQMNILYSQHQCHDLLLNPYMKLVKKNPYDVIMRSRPDILYRTPIDLKAYNTDIFMPKLTLYSPPSANACTVILMLGIDILMLGIPTDVTKMRKEDGVLIWFTNVKGINDQIIIGSVSC